MMEEHEAFGERLGDRFGVSNVPVLVSKTLQKTQVAVTLIESDKAASVMSEPLPPEDAFLVHLNLVACDHELWVGDRALGRCMFGQGETAIHDLKQPPRALVHTVMGSMMMYLPRKLLDELCDDADVPRIEGLFLDPGTSVDDPTVRHLGSALYKALQRPDQASPLFIDHLTFALSAHVAQKYGKMRKSPFYAQGPLADWQTRRVKEVLSNNLDGNVLLEALASECQLSVGHFIRSFRRSVGEPPHRWMLRQRIERATSLLKTSSLSLAEIAVACGFCDQSHLSRCFKSIVGVSPGAWRRDFKN